MKTILGPRICFVAILTVELLTGMSFGHESTEPLPSAQNLDLGGGLQLETVLIPAGKFVMGSPMPTRPESMRIGQVIFALGSALAVALPLTVKARAVAKRQKAKYSLGGLLCFVFAVNLIIYGGFRWRNTALALAEYHNFMGKFSTSESPPHLVTLTQPFYMGKFPVTQAQYQQVMRLNPSSTFSANNPVDLVSWDDAQVFCKRLSAQAKRVVRLPTEAEWEYSCQAGCGNANDLADNDPEWGRYKNCGFEEYCHRRKRFVASHPVGEKPPNGFGLYDMLGSIGQWCEDFYGNYAESPVEDPRGPDDECDRVVRGGYRSMRTTSREYNHPNQCDKFTGFRVVVTTVAKMP